MRHSIAARPTFRLPPPVDTNARGQVLLIDSSSTTWSKIPTLDPQMAANGFRIVALPLTVIHGGSHTSEGM
jgi:hypothetical protein